MIIDDNNATRQGMTVTLETKMVDSMGSWRAKRGAAV